MPAGAWVKAQGPFPDTETANQYLDVFQKESPGVKFALAVKCPRDLPNPLRSDRSTKSKAHHIKIDAETHRMLAELQRIHDAYSPINWAERLDDAETFFFMVAG